MRALPFLLLAGTLVLVLLGLGFDGGGGARAVAPGERQARSTPEPATVLPAPPQVHERAAAAPPPPEVAAPEGSRALPLVFVVPDDAPPEERITVQLFTSETRMVGGHPRSAHQWTEAGRLEDLLPGPARRLYVPAGATCLRVTVSADHLFLESPVQRLGLPATGPLEPARVVLGLGGGLHFRLVPPEPCPFDTGVLHGRVLNVTTSRQVRDLPFMRTQGYTLRGRIEEDLVIRLRGLSPNLYYDLMGPVQPFVSVLHRESRVTPGETVVVHVPLRPGLTLSGWVVDHMGSPLPDADLWISHADGGRSGGGVASVGDQGMFRLRGITPSLTSITARHEGLLPTEVLRADLPRGFELHGIVITLWPANSLAGTVRHPDGRPVPGAALELTPVRGDEVLDRTLADTEGRFHFLDLEDRMYRVRCAADPADGANARPGDKEVEVELTAD